MKLLRWLEWLLMACGFLMLLAYLTALFQGRVLAEVEVKRFMLARQTRTTGTKTTSPVGPDAVDFNSWSKERIAAYEESLKARFAPPLAVLHIAKIQLTVPILEGTDELTLNRAVGHIGGTALPGQDGNVGIAGHRDSFFRGLKDIRPGDEITLLLSEGETTYVVDRLTIVEPRNVGVLRPGDRSSVTLVTCYPFHFVGDAPKRYIVHAALSSNGGATLSGAADNSLLRAQMIQR
jgi:sortase A